MPRITIKTNLFLSDQSKHHIAEELKEAIELIPCEKGDFVMADFADETFMLFGANASSPCASIEVAVIENAFAACDRALLTQVLVKMTEAVMHHTKIPEDRIFAFYRNSPLWTYQRKDIIGTLLQI